MPAAGWSGPVDAAVPVVLAVAKGQEPDLRAIDSADAWLFDDDDPEVMATVLHDVTGGRGLQVADSSDTVGRISALSAEAARIAEALARLARADAGSDTGTQPVSAGLVRRIVRLRRDRERYFPAEIFADPAWDMLLELTAARMEGQKVPVSSLCVAAAVPTTTALRWIRSLTAAGVLERHDDPFNARRAFLHLSPVAVEAMMNWLRGFNAAFALR